MKNLDTLQAASRAQELIGYILEDSVYDCRTGGEGVFCGELKRGHGSIHDQYGSTIVEVDAQGSCRGQTAVHLGWFEECSRKELAEIALYCFFIDPDFRNENLEDEPDKELVEVRAGCLQCWNELTPDRDRLRRMPFAMCTGKKAVFTVRLQRTGL